MISFFVQGTPKPQGSKRAFTNKRTGQPILVESAGAPLKDWRTDVRAGALDASPDVPLAGPLVVKLEFSLRRPKSHPKTRVTYPEKRPDIDKLARAVLDALTGVTFEDDGQIIGLSAVKKWGNPQGVQVTVSPFPK